MSKNRKRSSRRPGRLINAAGAAELLGVPVSHIYVMTRAGRLPHHRVGRYLRYDPTELLRATRRGGGGFGKS